MKIVGVSINLRDRALGDLETYRRWMTPDAQWKQFDAPWEPVKPMGETELIEWPFRVGLERNRSPRHLLEIETSDGQHLGHVSWFWENEACAWAEVGLVIFDPAQWGQGYGPEALALWVDYLFSSTDWVRLGLGTWSGHRRMIRAAERVGFRLEATFRKARIVRGERADAVRYGMLREEWQNMDWIGCSSARE